MVHSSGLLPEQDVHVPIALADANHGQVFHRLRFMACPSHRDRDARKIASKTDQF